MRRKILAALGVAALGVWTAQPRSAIADDRPTIPVIVKDTTSFYWQIVLAGARAAGKEFNVNVPELGAQSEGDIAGQISILENAVAGKPAAIVIAPTQFSGLGKPIDQAAKSTKVVGIDGTADTNRSSRSSALTTSPAAPLRRTRSPKGSRRRRVKSKATSPCSPISQVRIRAIVA